MNASARRINHLAHALGARSYLEIGVLDGNTFRDVEIAARVAVDPAFRFDIRPLANEHTRFAAQNSDQFFADMPPGQLFDIIFIDGLHQFEQVVRDFANAVTHSHAKSVILLDDTRPTDVYSAIPDFDESLRQRRLAKAQGTPWHGDVYKMLFYIHDFWPGMNYRTIAGAGNPQSLVWRSNRFSRTPLCNSLERISRLSYFDLLADVRILNECSEAEALDTCVREVRG